MVPGTLIIMSRERETLENLPRRSLYVFCNETSKPIRSIRTAFEHSLKRAGIRDFHFHDLRHTFASNLVMAGVDLATVKELLGHKSIEMTMRYSHLSPSHKRQAVERLVNQMDTNMDTSLRLVDKALA